MARPKSPEFFHAQPIFETAALTMPESFTGHQFMAAVRKIDATVDSRLASGWLRTHGYEQQPGHQCQWRKIPVAPAGSQLEIVVPVPSYQEITSRTSEVDETPPPKPNPDFLTDDALLCFCRARNFRFMNLEDLKTAAEALGFAVMRKEVSYVPV